MSAIPTTYGCWGGVRSWPAALSLPVIGLAMVPAWQFDGWQWLCLLLSLPVAGLISLGSLAALGWSGYALLFGAAGEIG